MIHKIQTLNATDITCHSCEPGAVLSHTMRPDTQIQTMQQTSHSHEPMDTLSHTTQYDTQVQIFNATDIAVNLGGCYLTPHIIHKYRHVMQQICPSHEPGGVLFHTTQRDTQIQTLK